MAGPGEFPEAVGGPSWGEASGSPAADEPSTRSLAADAAGPALDAAGATAGSFVMLAAEFLAIIQVLVYAGGIVVLYLFVVMLVNLKRPPEAPLDTRRQSRAGFVLAAVLLAELSAILVYTAGRPAPAPVPGPASRIFCGELP